MVTIVLVWNHERKFSLIVILDFNLEHQSPSITARLTTRWRTCCQKRRLMPKTRSPFCEICAEFNSSTSYMHSCSQCDMLRGIVHHRLYSLCMLYICTFLYACQNVVLKSFQKIINRNEVFGGFVGPTLIVVEF